MAENFLRNNETAQQFINRCTNLSNFDCQEEEMLWLMMGPRSLPLGKTIPISIVLLVIFLTGVVGNAAVCAVIIRHPAMHTATNYYLFSLAASDLLLLLFGLPNDLTVYWHQYPYSFGIVFCKLRALISEAASYVSVLTIVALSLERYLAICHPLHLYAMAGLRIIAALWAVSLLNASPFALQQASYVSVLTIVAFSLERYLAICHPLHLYAMAGLRRALRIIAALWAVSLLAASPFAVYTTVNYHDYPPGSGNVSTESAFCAMLELPSWYICELSSLVFFALPGLIILCLYVRMGLRIRYVMGSTHAHKPGSPGTLNGVNGSVHGEARQAQSKKAIIRMLAAVVVAFFVCWAPFHFQRLFFIYGAESPHYHTINEYLFSVAGAFYYVSATVNPILYNVMSHRYRLAFRETLCCSHPARTKSKYYREHSSIRETTVNHTSEGTHLVRVRSQHESRNKIERRALRRCSFYTTETTALCGEKWNHECCKDLQEQKDQSVLKIERTQPSASCNNNENSTNKVSFGEEFNKEERVDPDDINIKISIHLRK